MNYRIYLSLYCFVFFTIKNLSAQSTFEKVVGGDGSEHGYSIIHTSDGGIATCGQSFSFGFGTSDVYVLKFDASMNLQWTATVFTEATEYAYSMVQTSDGGYAVCGKNYIDGNVSWSVYVAKLDANGELLWAKAIGGTGPDYGYSIIQTSDNGLVICGQTQSFFAADYDVYIVKLNADGVIQWSKTVGGTNADWGSSIINTSDGGFAIGGFTASFGAGGGDFYLIKMDANGNLQWTKTIGGDDTDMAFSITQASDGGYALAGYTFSFGQGQEDIYIVKLNSAGILQWTKTIGGSNIDDCNSIIHTSDGGYAIAGTTRSFGGGNDDAYVIKLNSSGELQWTQTMGEGSDDNASSIIQDSDGGYVFSGQAVSFNANLNGGIYIVKLDSTGNTCNVSGGGGILSTGGTVSSGGTVTVVNSTQSNNGTKGTGGSLLNICSSNVGINETLIHSGFSIFPNPSNGIFALRYNPLNSETKMTITNFIGENVFVAKLPAGSTQRNISINLPQGIYFVELSEGKNEYIQKIYIE